MHSNHNSQAIAWTSKLPKLCSHDKNFNLFMLKDITNLIILFTLSQRKYYTKSSIMMFHSKFGTRLISSLHWCMQNNFFIVKQYQNCRLSPSWSARPRYLVCTCWTLKFLNRVLDAADHFLTIKQASKFHELFTKKIFFWYY